MTSILDTTNVNNVSHLIQLSVAPVFLLAGVAGLLNVFTGRLSRIIDKVDKFMWPFFTNTPTFFPLM